MNTIEIQIFRMQCLMVTITPTETLLEMMKEAIEEYQQSDKKDDTNIMKLCEMISLKRLLGDDVNAIDPFIKNIVGSINTQKFSSLIENPGKQ